MTLAPNDPRHGTKNGYGNIGCRCALCREANRISLEAWRRRNGVRPIREVLDERIAEADARDNHGTETRYKHGCRCETCRLAQNAVRSVRRKRPNVAQHGSHTSYANGCRCDACRAAHTAYTRERRQQKRQAAA